MVVWHDALTIDGLWTHGRVLRISPSPSGHVNNLMDNCKQLPTHKLTTLYGLLTHRVHKPNNNQKISRQLRGLWVNYFEHYWVSFYER